MSDKKSTKTDKSKGKVEKKTIFHKKSDAGKGDKPRVGISYEEWGKKWEAVFHKKKGFVRSHKSDNSGSES